MLDSNVPNPKPRGHSSSIMNARPRTMFHRMSSKGARVHRSPWYNLVLLVPGLLPCACNWSLYVRLSTTIVGSMLHARNVPIRSYTTYWSMGAQKISMNRFTFRQFLWSLGSVRSGKRTMIPHSFHLIFRLLAGAYSFICDRHIA